MKDAPNKFSIIRDRREAQLTLKTMLKFRTKTLFTAKVAKLHHAYVAGFIF